MIGSTPRLPVGAVGDRPHALHAPDRTWTETNCYVDLWIEVLHALGLDPLLAAAFTVSTDFEGDQWTFFKYPPEDLRAAYGIEVHELNAWRGPLHHTVEQLALGRLLTVEADGWFLPDTQGVSYRLAHVKTAIVPHTVDAGARRLGYFHNAGSFELAGDDFDGVFGTGPYADPARLGPYVELVRLDRLVRLDEADAVRVAGGLLRDHLARRPSDNPVTRLGTRLVADLDWLRGDGAESFHEWAFGMIRQCGSCADLAAAFCRRLAQPRDDPWLTAAAEHWAALSEDAKTLQFLTARATRGRVGPLSDHLDAMAGHWAAAQDAMSGWAAA